MRKRRTRSGRRKTRGELERKRRNGGGKINQQRPLCYSGHPLLVTADTLVV